jgi:hypothetical protein
MLDHIVKQRAELLKSYSNANDLQKSKGEGSKGGKVIGHTKSGKAIYEKVDHPSHANFNSKDHGDAAELHYTLFMKTKGAKSEGHYSQFSNHVTAYNEKEKEEKLSKKGKKSAKKDSSQFKDEEDVYKKHFDPIKKQVTKDLDLDGDEDENEDEIMREACSRFEEKYGYEHPEDAVDAIKKLNK